MQNLKPLVRFSFFDSTLIKLLIALISSLPLEHFTNLLLLTASDLSSETNFPFPLLQTLWLVTSSCLEWIGSYVLRNPTQKLA